MPSPSTSLASLRPAIMDSFSELDLALASLGFIGLRVLSELTVQVAAGPFGKVPVEQLIQDAALERSPSSGYSRSRFTFTADSFATVDRGTEDPIDDNEVAIYGEYVDVEQFAAFRSRDRLLRGMEKRIAALVFNTTTWTGASLTTALATPWSTFASAVPITDVNNARNKVFDSSGLRANTLIVSDKTFRNVRECAQVVDRIKYSGFQDPTSREITAIVLAQVFDLPRVLVGGAPKNTAAEGQNAVFGSVWDDDMAMVCVTTDDSDIKTPCIGRTFHYTEDGSTIQGVVERYRDEAVRSDWMRVRHQTHEKVIYPEAGHLITNTI